MQNLTSSFPTNYDAALFEHLIDGIKEYAIFMIDCDGKIVTWNPGVKRLLGYDENEFIGATFSVIFSPEDVKLNIPLSELDAARSSGRAEDERWHKKKDGSLFWASGLVTLMKQDGQPIGFAKIMRDQTQKKRFEEQLAAQANALATANKELTNFAGVLSHDLNAPLQTVCGFASILKEQEGLDAEAEESVEHIVAGTKRMIRLVSDLLQYSTVADANANLKFVDSAALLQDVLVGLTALIKSSGAKVSASDLPTVWADPTQLGRVLQNLIENAIKYCKPGNNAEIKVTATEGEGETIFSVTDNGRGIDEKELPRLFTLFERLHPDEGISGRGIGLATCKRIVERLGGRMWAESKVNQGSAFFFSIPHPAETASSRGASASNELMGSPHPCEVRAP